MLGRDVAVTLPLISRLVPHFGEDPEDLPTTLFEIAPTVLFTVPRYLQKFASQILVGIGNSSTLKRASLRACDAIGAPACAPPLGRAAPGFARHALRSRATPPCSGRSSTSSASTGSSWSSAAARRCPPRRLALWQMYGVNVVEMYGQTETRGRHHRRPARAVPAAGRRRHGAAGLGVVAGADGEVLVQQPRSVRGLLEQRGRDARGRRPTTAVCTPATSANGATAALRLIDRARDFIVTSGGKTVSPSLIENVLRATPYVAEAVVFGHGRKYLTALIEIDYDTVADWARSRDVPYTGFTSLAQNPEVNA